MYYHLTSSLLISHLLRSLTPASSEQIHLSFSLTQNQCRHPTMKAFDHNLDTYWKIYSCMYFRHKKTHTIAILIPPSMMLSGFSFAQQQLLIYGECGSVD